MSTLAEFMGGLITAIQVHPICESVGITDTKEFSSEQFSFKIRAVFRKGIQFQARIYFNKGHIDYAYQVFTDKPVMRWDNKEEFSHLTTFPHHFHDPYGNVRASDLKGDPIQDIQFILTAISDYPGSQ